MEKIELSDYSEHLAPSKISFYSVLESRLLHLPSKLADDIRRTKTGLRGEIEAVDIFQKNGRSDWNYISNLWIDDNGRYEIDLLVITKAAIYVFEIKNYEGIFTYNNGDCTLGNLELDENCISQASRSHKKFHKFCKNANIICPVYGGVKCNLK